MHQITCDLSTTTPYDKNSGSVAICQRVIAKLQELLGPDCFYPRDARGVAVVICTDDDAEAIKYSDIMLSILGLWSILFQGGSPSAQFEVTVKDLHLHQVNGVVTSCETITTVKFGATGYTRKSMCQNTIKCQWDDYTGPKFLSYGMKPTVGTEIASYSYDSELGGKPDLALVGYYGIHYFSSCTGGKTTITYRDVFNRYSADDHVKFRKMLASQLTPEVYTLLSPDTPAACPDCGADYDDTFSIVSVPDDIWPLINQDIHKKSGMLCPTCTVKRLSSLKLGLVNIIIDTDL